MRTRAQLTAVAAIGAALLAAPGAAQAANKCTTQAERGKVVAQSASTVLYSTGSLSDSNLYVYACQFKTQKRFRLPGQDGGTSEFLGVFRLAGRYLAWQAVNSEEASAQSQGTVRVMDLKTRKQVVTEYVGLAPESNSSATIAALVLNTKGAVAWTTRGTGEVTDHSVHAVAPGGEVAVLDRGGDVNLRSLALSADGKRIYWERADQVKSALMPTG